MKFATTRTSLVFAMVALTAGMTCQLDDLQAQSPLNKLKLPFQKRVEADSNASYDLQETNGPWMIMAASFEGEKGELQARELVQEIRSEFNQPAYTYKKRMDFTQDIAGRDWQLDANDPERIVHKRMKHANSVVLEETAVLVGNFATLDDTKGQKILKQLKVARAKSLPFGPDAKTFQRLGELRAISPEDTESGRGPMRGAFMCLNPALPDNYLAQQGPDEFILKLNKKVEHSLLDCPGKYSIRVATFRGDTSFSSEEVDKKKKEFDLKRLMGKRVESKLALAADKANQLTVALRERHVEAYEFHDRSESYVCVGSFDALGTPGADGRMAINPRVKNVIEMYKAEVDALPGISGVATPRTLPELPKISFDMQPLPIEVPRQSVLDRTARRSQSPR